MKVKVFKNCKIRTENLYRDDTVISLDLTDASNKKIEDNKTVHKIKRVYS